MKMTMFGGQENGSFPLLKGKAAEIRHFGPALSSAFEHFMDHTNQQHQQIMLIFKSILNIELILDHHAAEYRFPPEVAKDFQNYAFGFVALSTALSKHYHTRGILLFNFTIKFHYTMHLGLMAAYINPRLGWCYSGEDMMQKIKLIVQASYKGTASSLVPSKVMKKYAQGIGYNLLQDMWKNN